jgi:hypothetical protein
VLGWKPGDTILLSAGRTFQIVRLHHDDADELSTFGFTRTKTRSWSSRM